MSTNAIAVAVVFLLLLTYGESLADDVERKYGRRFGNMVLVALLIGPTVALCAVNWELAAAGWGMRAVLACVQKLGLGPRYTPRDPKELPVEELERALATGLTGEALANDIAARRAAHLAKLAPGLKRS